MVILFSLISIRIILFTITSISSLIKTNYKITVELQIKQAISKYKAFKRVSFKLGSNALNKEEFLTATTYEKTRWAKQTQIIFINFRQYRAKYSQKNAKNSPKSLEKQAELALFKNTALKRQLCPAFLFEISFFRIFECFLFPKSPPKTSVLPFISILWRQKIK